MQTIVEHLVKARHEKANIPLYNALILANGDTQMGSAGEVAALFQEMETEGITPESATYHAILKVCKPHIEEA